MSVSRVAAVLLRHWLLVTLLTACLVGGVAATTFTTVPSYRASALLQVQTPIADAGTPSLQDTLTARERAVTLAALGNTARVARLASDRMSSERGLESCGVSQIGQSEFLDATCSGTARDVVASAANAYAAALQGLLETQRQSAIAVLAAAWRKEVQALKAEGVPPTDYPAPPSYPQYRELEIVDAATTPRSPYAPRPVRTLAIAFGLALLLNTALAFLVDHVQNRARTSEELGHALGEPVLVAIPAIGRGGVGALGPAAPRRTADRAPRQAAARGRG